MIAVAPVVPLAAVPVKLGAGSVVEASSAGAVTVGVAGVGGDGELPVGALARDDLV